MEGVIIHICKTDARGTDSKRQGEKGLSARFIGFGESAKFNEWIKVSSLSQLEGNAINVECIS